VRVFSFSKGVIDSPAVARMGRNELFSLSWDSQGVIRLYPIVRLRKSPPLRLRLFPRRKGPLETLSRERALPSHLSNSRRSSPPFCILVQRSPGRNSTISFSLPRAAIPNRFPFLEYEDIYLMVSRRASPLSAREISMADDFFLDK